MKLLVKVLGFEYGVAVEDESCGDYDVNGQNNYEWNNQKKQPSELFLHLHIKI